MNISLPFWDSTLRLWSALDFVQFRFKVLFFPIVNFPLLQFTLSIQLQPSFPQFPQFNLGFSFSNELILVSPIPIFREFSYTLACMVVATI